MSDSLDVAVYTLTGLKIFTLDQTDDGLLRELVGYYPDAMSNYNQVYVCMYVCTYGHTVGITQFVLYAIN